MQRKTIHLISNSHLDPVWLWEWQEGAAETLSLARTIAELCDEHETFVFNCNGASFYRWVEEYDPALFRRIRQLIKTGQWHVMGGWYVQPDCNMPSGESFVRQALLGKWYFKDRFGVEPTTAVNFDPFGHTRGLVQILAKSGYDSYLFCRPDPGFCALPANEFVWVGYDGSEILATRVEAGYASRPGGARDRALEWMSANPNQECGLVAWGAGNHGGGPTRADLRGLARLIRETKSVQILHSTPERYFGQLRRQQSRLARHRDDINPWAVGCYTSMARVKQKHRMLENELYAAEKMATTAAVQGLMPYPRADFEEATRDLLFSEFHDALPGSSIPPVEEGVVQLLDHGLELVTRVKTRAFFTLTAGQRRARAGEFPILVYNPHPYRVATVVECEFQPAASHGTTRFALPQVYQGGKQLPCQPEKEHANINEDIRKRVVFPAVLEPSRMNRFDCRLKMVARKPKPALRERRGTIRFKTRELEIVINTRTGLVDRYRVGGRDYVGRSAFCPLVMADNADPWGMTVRRFRNPAGKFRLMPRGAGTVFSGVAAGTLPSVRVIEDGPVRSVVEAVLAYGESFICQRYKLPKRGTEIEVETRVHWNEKDRMLKLSIPAVIGESRASARAVLPDATYSGQVAYGVGDLPDNGDEAVAQKWVAVVSRRQNTALTCINDRIYGSDMARGELRLSLLRSSAHSGHPTGPGRPIVQQDRYTPRIDQGERVFRFWVNAGPASGRLARIDREALVHNEQPFTLCFSPSGAGDKPLPGVVLSDPTIQLAAFKQAEDGKDLIIRLFEPTGRKRSTTLSLPFARARKKVNLSPFEIKTLRFNANRRQFTEVDLLERPLRR